MQRVDFLGAFLLIAANLTLVTALLEASTTFSWSSPTIIALLAVSGFLWVLFVAWEWFATKEHVKQEPVFPFRFFHNRYWMGMILQSAFVGVPFTVLVVDLPQRFQAVNNLSALDAGVRLLPYAMLAPIGSLVSNMIFIHRKAPLTLLAAGASFQLVGLTLLATIPVSITVPAAQYGYQAIAGFGVGITFGTLVTITPGSVEPRDLATATGAMIQFRQMVRLRHVVPMGARADFSVSLGRRDRPDHRLESAEQPSQVPACSPCPHARPARSSVAVDVSDWDLCASAAKYSEGGVREWIQFADESDYWVCSGTVSGIINDDEGSWVEGGEDRWGTVTRERLMRVDVIVYKSSLWSLS